MAASDAPSFRIPWLPKLGTLPTWFKYKTNDYIERIE